MRGRRRVPENAYSCRIWNGLMQDFQLLGRDFGENHRQPCDVSTWMSQALDMPYANGIGMVCKHNRDCFGRLPRRLYPCGSWRKDEINPPLDQQRCETRQLIDGIRPLEVDQQVLALNISKIM